MNDKLKNKILLRFEEFRAIPYIDTYVHSQKPFKFKCFCGNIEYSRTWATLCNSKIACVHCLKIEEKKVMFNARLKSVKSKILNICNKYGCVPEVNLYEGSKIPFPIKCRCGVNMERSWCSFDKKGKTPLCPECSLENSTEKSRENARIKILPKIIENCREYGATYMEGTYIGSSYPFKILCRCGEVTQKIWKNYTFNNGKMLCPKCKYALIPKGKDHHNWNSLLDPKDRGRDNECREWSKLILEKFKYTCAISGQVGGKLNSHHIYSSADLFTA